MPSSIKIPASESQVAVLYMYLRSSQNQVGYMSDDSTKTRFY